MPASEARILANKANAQHSTGSQSSEGKAQSRANAYKHGLTGDGVVVSDRDALKIELLAAELKAEFRPSGTTGRMLVERMAVLAVRMERSVAQETAAISGRVRQAEADFAAPEGLDDKTVARLRREAGDLALFDPSKEACLARKYEAAAERGFFRALKELRAIEGEHQAPIPSPEAAIRSPEPGTALGSFGPIEEPVKPREILPVPASRSAPASPSKTAAPPWTPLLGGTFDVPITIGRAS